MSTISLKTVFPDPDDFIQRDIELYPSQMTALRYLMYIETYIGN